MPKEAPDIQTPGGRIRFLRETKDLTQAALAAKVYVSQPAVAQWETNKWLPGRQSQMLLAEALGCTREFLFPSSVTAGVVAS